MEIARHKNGQSLPLIKPYSGPRLPPDRYCLSAPNFRLAHKKKVCVFWGHVQNHANNNNSNNNNDSK